MQPPFSPIPRQPAVRSRYHSRQSALPRLADNPRWLIFAAALLFISLALLPFFATGGLIAFYGLTGRTYPGIMIGNIPAGDLVQESLAQKLDTAWNGTQRIVLTDGRQNWPAYLLDLGLWVDPQATAAKAYEIGRGEQAVGELLWLVRFGESQVAPVVVFDPQVGRAGLERLSARVNIPAVEATLRLEGGQWVAVPGQNGSMLDVDATLALISAQPQQIAETGYVPVVLRPVAPRLADATPALEQLRAALDNPLRLQAYDPITDENLDWSIPREVFANWVTVQMAGEQLVLGLDGQQVSGYLQSMQPGENRFLAPFDPPADLTERWKAGQPLVVTLRHTPTSYTVEAGDTLTRIAFKVGMPYWMIQRANPGINADQLRTGQVLTIPSKDDLLPLPVIPGKRIVISINQQRMWIYENGSLRNEHLISTGIDRSPTIPGVYQVQTHEKEAYASVWDLYMPHFMGIYEGWPGFMNGIHGLPTLSSGRRLWAGNLGNPVSYGCIILGLQEAEDLFNWAEAGVIVEIIP